MFEEVNFSMPRHTLCKIGNGITLDGNTVRVVLHRNGLIQVGSTDLTTEVLRWLLDQHENTFKAVERRVVQDGPPLKL